MIPDQIARKESVCMQTTLSPNLWYQIYKLAVTLLITCLCVNYENVYTAAGWKIVEGPKRSV